MQKYEYLNIQKQISKIFHKKRCLHPDSSGCQGGIIRSHSIQKNGALQHIEGPQGHVWGFVQNKKMDGEGPLLVDKISINDASTFNGFCAYHDNSLFHCVDDFDFEPTNEQVFMLTYRTIVRESYTKSASAESNTHISTIANEIPDLLAKKAMSEIVSTMGLGTAIGENYSVKIVSDMFNDLGTKDFSKIRYFLIKTKNFSDVVTSGAFMPDFDYDGKVINDYKNNYFHWVALNIFSDSKNGLILFSWIDNEQSEQFVKSLLNQSEIPNKAIELAFTNIENTFFSERWWKALKTVKKSRVEKMVLDWIHYDDNLNYTGIRRNNLQYVNYEIDSIKQNFLSDSELTRLRVIELLKNS